MKKNTLLKTICGVALAALVSARPTLAQEGDSHCPTFCEGECPPCEEVTFTPEEPDPGVQFRDRAQDQDHGER